MNDNKLYSIIDLIEELNKVQKLIELHKANDSDFMFNQYNSKKLKLTGFLFKELTSTKDSSTENMYLISLFLNKFYSNELKNTKFSDDDNLKRIEELMS